GWRRSRPLVTFWNDRGLCLSNDRKTRFGAPRGLGRHSRRSRLYASILCLSRPFQGVETSWGRPSVRSVDADDRVSEGGRGAHASSLSVALGFATRVAEVPWASSICCRRDDATQAGHRHYSK